MRIVLYPGRQAVGDDRAGFMSLLLLPRRLAWRTADAVRQLIRAAHRAGKEEPAVAFLLDH
jgi:hypothetical protein